MIVHDGNGKGDDLREKDQLDRVVVFCLISFFLQQAREMDRFTLFSRME
jgi:hypothetical protein